MTLETTKAFKKKRRTYKYEIDYRLYGFSNTETIIVEAEDKGEAWLVADSEIFAKHYKHAYEIQVASVIYANGKRRNLL